MIEVRTGIVLQEAHFLGKYLHEGSPPGDLDFDETIARAESEARGKLLVGLANVVNSHLAPGTK